MVVNSVIVTGMGAIVRSSAHLTMTHMGITLVTEPMVVKFVWKIGLDPSAKHIAKQWITQWDITTVLFQMALRDATNTGMAPTV